MTRRTTTALDTRPPPGFPRWGYLDKFEVNEYMARALFATLGACLVLMCAVSLFLKPGAGRPTVTVTRPVGTRVVIDLASVVFESTSRPIPHGLSSSPRRHGGVKPVPDMAAEQETIDPVGTYGPSAGGPGGETAGPFDDVVLPGIQATTYPGFDDFVAVEKLPELITMPEPTYPELAREAGVEGRVLVRVLVGRDGLVEEEVIVQGVLGLDEAALAAAARAVFEPALQQGSAVAVWILVPIDFVLHD